MKTIALPGQYDFDVSHISNLLDQPQLVRLRHIKQLGLAHMVFPQATHTRFAHSMGTAAFSAERANHWMKKKLVTPEEAQAIYFAGMLHDTGHYPFSHVIEAVCTSNHKYRSEIRVEELRWELEKLNVNVNMVKDIIVKKHPLSPAVTHKCLGTDKIQYLMYDARHTTENVSLRYGDLIKGAFCIDGRMAIREEYMEELIDLLDTYRRMYVRVYLRKACMVLQSFLQKLTQEAMEYGDLREESIWEMVDSELEEALRNCTYLPTKQRFLTLMEKRAWPKCAVAILPEGAHPPDRLLRKQNYVYRVPFEMMARFEKLTDRNIAYQQEKEIARILDCSPDDVLLVPSLNAHQFEPDSIDICDGKMNIIESFNEMRPEYFAYLRSSMRHHMILRVCVAPEMRNWVSQKETAEEIITHLMDTFCS